MVKNPRLSEIQKRAKYARTNKPIANLLVNDPAGFPSAYPPAPIWYLGSDQLGAYAYDESAATLSSVSRATSLIVDTLTGLNWRHLSGGASPRTSSIELPSPRWLNDPQLVRPDDRYPPPAVSAGLRLPRAAFWGTILRSVIYYGMGYMIMEETVSGEPLAGSLRILHPDMVTPQFSTTLGYVNRRIGPNNENSALVVETDFNGYFSIGSITYKLVEFRNPLSTPNELGCTLGIIGMHAKELGLAQQSVNYSQGMFRSGIPSGYLKVSTPYTEAQSLQLRQQWENYHSSKDQRSTAVLSATVDYVPISISPIDAQLIENRYFSLVDVSNMFGIPVYLLGGKSDSATYSNSESRSLDFKVYGLSTWSCMTEEVLSSLMPQGHWIELDYRTLLKSDTKTRYESYNLALQGGYLEIEEIRRLENLPSLVGGEEPPLEGPSEVTNEQPAA